MSLGRGAAQPLGMERRAPERDEGIGPNARIIPQRTLRYSHICWSIRVSPLDILSHIRYIYSAMPKDSEEDLLPTIWKPWMGDELVASRVPVTTPTRYVSFRAALNLRLPGEHTGDWHKTVFFYTAADNPYTLKLAGPGGLCDSTPSLGSKGVRDMADLLVVMDVIPEGSGPVWVANHYRAITDLVLGDVTNLRCTKIPRVAPVYTINQWLDTEEQIEHLVQEYLMPLTSQLPPEEKEVHEEWIPTVVWP